MWLQCVVQLGSAIPVNVIMFAPAVLIGVIGGVLGAIFTILNIKMARFRRRIFTRLRHVVSQKILRFFEPLVIVVRTVAFVFVVFNRNRKVYSVLFTVMRPVVHDAV